MASSKAKSSVSNGNWDLKYDKYFVVHEERKAKGEKLVEYVDQ